MGAACDAAPANDQNEQEVFRPRIFLREGDIVREVKWAETAKLPPGTEKVMLVDGVRRFSSARN